MLRFRISEVCEKAKEDFRTPNASRSHKMCKLRFRISEVCDKSESPVSTSVAVSRLDI